MLSPCLFHHNLASCLIPHWLCLYLFPLQPVVPSWSSLLPVYPQASYLLMSLPDSSSPLFPPTSPLVVAHIYYPCLPVSRPTPVASCDCDPLVRLSVRLLQLCMDRYPLFNLCLPLMGSNLSQRSNIVIVSI